MIAESTYIDQKTIEPPWEENHLEKQRQYKPKQQMRVENHQSKFNACLEMEYRALMLSIVGLNGTRVSEKLICHHQK